MNRNKKIVIISIITILLIGTLGVTFAFFSYNKQGSNQQLVLGDIYMHYNESNAISLANAMPGDDYKSDSYFEFTIQGKNTYTKKDIWYDISLVKGDLPDGKTEENRIPDKYLKFKLVEVNGGVETELFKDKTYEDLTNQRIYVAKIAKNTTSEINKTYRLYMTVSENLTIGTDADFTMETWKAAFASVKVNATGDFTEKYLPASNSLEFKTLTMQKHTETSKTYIKDENIIYLSGTNASIDFNYVWYSGKLWRITAIYPDGTMKMITDDVITTTIYGTNEKFYTDESNKAYVYQWLNEDFLDTLYNYDNFIVVGSKWNMDTASNISEKLSKTAMATSPVGLLNTYEYYMSYKNAKSLTGYLNIEYSWWLLNPFSDSNVRIINDEGRDMIVSVSRNAYGVRPSVTLKSTIEFLSGEGTKTNPYKLKGDNEEVKPNVTLLNTRQSGEYLRFDGELYRIVNIEEGKTKINKNNYIKDGSNAVLSKKFSNGSVTWGNGTVDDYWDYYLNHTWYNGISETYKNMLVKGTYYLGTVAYGDSYKGAICKVANNTITTKDCEKTESVWNGFVGLPRYGEMFASQQEDGYSSSSTMWFLNPSSDSSVWYVDSYGDIYFSGGSVNGSSAARPSMYLKSDVKITSGSGTKEQPFEISL